MCTLLLLVPLVLLLLLLLLLLRVLLLVMLVLLLLLLMPTQTSRNPRALSAHHVHSLPSLFCSSPDEYSAMVASHPPTCLPLIQMFGTVRCPVISARRPCT